MKQVKIEVKNCRSCPFSESENLTGVKEFYNCLAPVEIHVGMYQIDSYYKNYKSPKWCPLKKQSLKIEFKK